jgi:hypothetical protein
LIHISISAIQLFKKVEQNTLNYFTFLKNHNITFKVLHLSDEFCSDSIDFYTYSNCKAIVRNYWRPDLPKLSHIINIPLGYHYKGKSNKTFLEREIIWSFHGTNWFNRDKILNKLYNISPYSCHLTNTWNDSKQTTYDNYIEVLSNSKFCPILRGNNIETFRLYEVLELGTIPIYVRTEGDDEFWKLISSKLNFYELENWEKAAQLIKTFINNVELAETYRHNLIKKWNNWKKEIQAFCIQMI